MAPGAHIVADWTLYAPLTFSQVVDNRLADLQILELRELKTEIAALNVSELEMLFLADMNRYYDLEAAGPDVQACPDGLLFVLRKSEGEACPSHE